MIDPSETLYSSEGFKRAFLESLKTPNIVTRDDPPDVAAIKRAVDEAKIEMKARYDAGEDLARIMIETREELKALAQYRQDIEKELAEAARNKDATEADMEDFLTAANMLLEKKGIGKLTMPRTAALRFQRMKTINKQGVE